MLLVRTLQSIRATVVMQKYPRNYNVQLLHEVDAV